jgi:hypothetical protein
MNVLAVWQAHRGLSDRAAAAELGLELKEFARQKATKPSRQTCLLATLIALYQPDMAKIAATAAALDPPATSKEAAPISPATGHDAADRPGRDHGGVGLIGAAGAALILR